MYLWRKLSLAKRAEMLAWRKEDKRPWHSPPHRQSDRTDAYLFTAACYEHTNHIGYSIERMTNFEERLLRVAREHAHSIEAWVVLPNHYHFLARTTSSLQMLKALGKLHGSTSFGWNGEEERRGRQIWHRAVETVMKSEGHFWATVNYLHHNPVKHGYVEKWQDWPFSSVHDFMEANGREEAQNLWKDFPIMDYGKGWDD
jgi:putative transposase